MVWSLAADRESQIMVTMEFRMNERKVFLWTETRWQLRLLQGETERPMFSRGAIKGRKLLFFLFVYLVEIVTLV